MPVRAGARGSGIPTVRQTLDRRGCAIGAAYQPKKVSA